MSSATASSIRPILCDRPAADREYRQDIGHTKRFLERFAADQEFRNAVEADPAHAPARWGLLKDAEDLRPLWDKHLPRDPAAVVSNSVARYRAFHREKIALVPSLQARGEVQDPNWRAWRQRQIARCHSHLGPKAQQLVHAPFCIELGKGCSVGCWFCAVSAGRLGEQLAYTAQNRTFWRECLEVLREVFGEAATAGYCYWGNDPLDNPDYESFLIDFHDIIQAFPQTTTAQADRHVERVRALLRLSEEKGGLIDRFSVLTLKQWDRIHQAFDASDMVYVECVPQNKEAYASSKVVAGRALERERKQVAQGQAQPTPEDETSTIACVSGFYLNMVDRSVQLITPCNASQRWPLGHWVLDQDHFSDARSLHRLLKSMGDRHMRATLRSDDVVRLRSDLTYEETAQGFAVSTRYVRHQVNLAEPLASMVQAGQHPVSELALALDAPLHQTYHLLNEQLFDRGLLDEEPEPISSESGTPP